MPGSVKWGIIKKLLIIIFFHEEQSNFVIFVFNINSTITMHTEI